MFPTQVRPTTTALTTVTTAVATSVPQVQPAASQPAYPFGWPAMMPYQWPYMPVYPPMQPVSFMPTSFAPTSMITTSASIPPSSYLSAVPPPGYLPVTAVSTLAPTTEAPRTTAGMEDQPPASSGNLDQSNNALTAFFQEHGADWDNVTGQLQFLDEFFARTDEVDELTTPNLSK